MKQIKFRLSFFLLAVKYVSTQALLVRESLYLLFQKAKVIVREKMVKHTQITIFQ